MSLLRVFCAGSRCAVMAALCVVFMLSPAVHAWAECGLINTGFEAGREDGWRHWGGEDTRTEFYGFLPFEGERFARIWGHSGSYQDVEVEAGMLYGLRARAAVSSAHSMTPGMFGAVKIEWRKKEGTQDQELSRVEVRFDTQGAQQVTLAEDVWTLLEILPTAPPAGTTHVRAVLCTVTPPGADGCALFDAVELFCEKGESHE